MVIIDGNVLMSNSTVFCSMDFSLGTIFDIFDMFEKQSGLMSSPNVVYDL